MVPAGFLEAAGREQTIARQRTIACDREAPLTDIPGSFGLGGWWVELVS